MPIGNFQQRLQDDDRNSLNLRNNPPDTDPEFNGDSGGIDWDSISDGEDIFGSSSDPFGGSTDLFGSSSDPFRGSSDPFGSSSNQFGGSSSPFGSQSSPFGSQSDPFGSSSNQFGGSSDPFGSSSNQFGKNPFGNPFMSNSQSVQQKPDNMDKLMQGGIEVGKSTWQILKQSITQVKHRTFDDLGYYSRNLIITGGFIGVVGLLITIVQYISGAKFIIESGITLTTVITGVLVAGIGLVQIGQAAIALANADNEPVNVDNMPDIKQIDPDDSTSDYEENLDDELADLFEDDDQLDDLFSSDNDQNNQEDSNEYTINNYNWEEDEDDTNRKEQIEEIDLDKTLDNIKENQLLTRHNLIQNMLPFFPLNKPNFSDMREIEPESNDFNDLELITVKAIANVMQKEIEEVQTKLLDAKEGLFSYILRFKRINQLNTDQKREALASEFVNYMRQSPTDRSVQATVELDGDYFVVTVQKGEQAVVTIGDILQKEENRQFFEDEDNKLPMVVGMDDLGNVILDDAKKFDTCMIMGKPRSGKQWYVFNILMNMMAFNSPDDVQFIIVDPKQANLFFKLSYMPHVIGLHSDKNVLDIMDDIIENEGERRKKLLKDNECDDIWGLRRKGINLPILYLVIDEVITVMGNLRAQDPKKEKEFNLKLKILISELPYVGIRLIFIPHRATGLVDKTNRAMLQFIAAVRSARDEIEEGLGTSKWYRGLTKPGDMAIKLQTREDAFYARGPAIATSDEKTADIITTIAKAYYKLGFSPSDLKQTLTVSYNRDEDDIKDRLNMNGIIQYNANKVLTDDDLDLYDQIQDKFDSQPTKQTIISQGDCGRISHLNSDKELINNTNRSHSTEHTEYNDDTVDDLDDETWVGTADDGSELNIYNEVPDNDEILDIDDEVLDIGDF